MKRKWWPVLAAFAALLASNPAAGQSYPSKPIRIIVPLAAGGIADIFARIAAQHMIDTGKATVVVENRPGGAGTIGADAVAKSPPDGYTLVVGGHGSHAILVHLMKLPYEPATDFAPIIHIGTFPNLLVVHSSVPAKTAQEFVAYAKANPGKLSYASQGNGSSGHMMGEQFKMVAGVDIVHVPYRGAAAAVQDLVSGQVQMMFDTVTVQAPQIAAGHVRALAISAATRAQAVPDVPTMHEVGLAEVQGGAWFGLFAPTGTPKEAIDWIGTQTRQAFSVAEVRDRFLKQGAMLPLSGPDEFAPFIAAERQRWGDVIRKANIRFD